MKRLGAEGGDEGMILSEITNHNTPPCIASKSWDAGTGATGLISKYWMSCFGDMMEEKARRHCGPRQCHLTFGDMGVIDDDTESTNLRTASQGKIQQNEATSQRLSRHICRR